VPVLDNENVAVWWNKKSKEWNAVNDVCPHRQASLSDGVVNPKTACIKCRYHGIEFNKHGKCTLIPSSTFNPSIFSVKNYYIKEKYNLLWIDDEKDSDIVIDILEKTHVKSKWSNFFIDIPSFLIIENILDPLHFTHLHHGMLPKINRYKNPDVINNSYTNWFNSSGFSVDLYDTSNTKSNYYFVSPYMTNIIFSPSNILVNFIIPLNKTTSRHIGNAIIYTNKNTSLLNLMIKRFIPIIEFIGNKIVQQDISVMNTQDKIIKKNGKNYKPSGVADTPIILYNKWLDKYGEQTLF
tara:strand:- start:4249 stop:5133 length:885 start_codon:yes stop_codon:yes gene_type:complete